MSVFAGQAIKSVRLAQDLGLMAAASPKVGGTSQGLVLYSDGLVLYSGGLVDYSRSLVRPPDLGRKSDGIPTSRLSVHNIFTISQSGGCLRRLLRAPCLGGGSSEHT